LDITTNNLKILFTKKKIFGLLVPNPNVQTLGKVVGLSVKHTETEGRINEQLRRCTMQSAKKLHARRAAKEFDRSC